MDNARYGGKEMARIEIKKENKWKMEKFKLVYKLILIIQSDESF